MTGSELIEKLAVLVPPLWLILAPNAAGRRLVVPGTSSLGVSTVSPSRRRLGWVALSARVSAVDMTRCPTCGGRLRLVAVLSDRASIRRYLQGVDLPTEPPRLHQMT